MSLKHALLGFLTISPLSGYDLGKYFEESINNYWSAKRSQIYKTLDVMMKEKLITNEVIIQEDKPNKKVYHIADKGKTELLEWLSKPKELPSFHLKFLLQITFAYHIDDKKILELFHDYADKLRKRLEKIKNKKETKEFMECATPRMQYLWNLTLDNGVYYYQNELEWTKKVIKDLKNIPPE